MMRRFAGEFRSFVEVHDSTTHSTRLDSFDPIESSESLNSSNFSRAKIRVLFSDLKSDVDSIERLSEHLLHSNMRHYMCSFSILQSCQRPRYQIYPRLPVATCRLLGLARLAFAFADSPIIPAQDLFFFGDE